MAGLLQGIVQLGLVVDGIDELRAEGRDFLAQIRVHAGVCRVVARDGRDGGIGAWIGYGVELLAFRAVEQRVCEFLELRRGDRLGNGFGGRAQGPQLGLEAGRGHGTRGTCAVYPGRAVDESKRRKRLRGDEAGTSTTGMRGDADFPQHAKV